MYVSWIRAFLILPTLTLPNSGFVRLGNNNAVIWRIHTYYYYYNPMNY